jgi:membrane-associated phospholipid phosphatase
VKAVRREPIILMCLVLAGVCPTLGQQTGGSEGLATAGAATPAGGSGTGNPDDFSLTPSQLIPQIVQDEKSIWTFPARLVHGQDALPTAAFVLGTAALVALDPHDTPYFRRTSSFNGYNRVMSSRNAIIGMAAAPSIVYLAGLERKDSYAATTALMAGEAVVDAESVAVVMKAIDGRLRPSEIAPYGNYSNTWFKSPQPWYKAPGSFPSGHTVAAVSIATVFATRYRKHRWVPWVAYGLAGAVAFSRLTLSAHFPSDVFAGAFLGYAITHNVALQN